MKDRTKGKRAPRGIAVRGNLLRQLRQQAQWTQEQAAARAKVSDKLIRKAEAGGPIQFSSVQILASIYSRPGHLVDPKELLLLNQPVDLLRSLLRNLWTDNWRMTIDSKVAADVIVHCESGTLTGRNDFLDRYELLRQEVLDGQIEIEDGKSDQTRATCRWKQSPTQVRQPTQCLIRSGTMTIAVAQNMIHEIWDFWDPMLPISRGNLSAD